MTPFDLSDAAKGTDDALRTAQKAAVRDTGDAARVANETSKKSTWNATDRRHAWKGKGTDGKPPQRDVVIREKKTGTERTITESKELHHKKARRDRGGNEDSNLEEHWPTKHAEVDPARKVNYEVIEVLDERDPRK